jgi:GPH family glycoside/pentoside/hexuronide:cation symporter
MLLMSLLKEKFLNGAGQDYSFIVEGEENLAAEKIQLSIRKRGYSNSIYILSVFLSLFLLLTFFSTKERIQPPKEQETNLGKDLKDLIRNKPWVILLLIGLLFNVYNSIKQGIVVIYFTHYMHNQLLAASYMVGLMIASIGGAMVTSPLGRKWGKRNF